MRVGETGEAIAPAKLAEPTSGPVFLNQWPHAFLAGEIIGQFLECCRIVHRQRPIRYFVEAHLRQATQGLVGVH